MKYYCIGIKGAGMSTLAQILYDLGNDVSGYDDTVEHKFTQVGLDERGILIYHDQEHSIDKDTIVTYSVAFSEDHPEIVRVKKLGLQIKKYNEIMGEVIDLFTSIGVSGTHGKTTTSSLIRHIIEGKMPCNYFIGAGDGHATLDNKYFVVESDEFNRHFTAYHPTYSIITNIEAEHLECYRDINDIRDTFEIFANQTKKLIVANGDNEEVRKINYKTPVIFYGFNDDNDAIIKNLVLNADGSSFDLMTNDSLFGHFDIPLFGKHMVYDVVAAIILTKELGFSYDEIASFLNTFHNAKRRFAEEVYNGTIIIDDYAHHPTEIKVTLEAIRQKYPNEKLVVVFRPNTYSRTKDFTDDFVEALNIADKAFVTDILCNREKPEDYPDISSDLIISKLRNGDKISEDSIDKLSNDRDAVICFMGCAPVSSLIDAFKNILQ